jgi:hypothetical protein
MLPSRSAQPAAKIVPEIRRSLRRDGRVAEGARLESVYTGNRIGGSNPSLSAIPFLIFGPLEDDQQVEGLSVSEIKGCAVYGAVR